MNIRRYDVQNFWKLVIKDTIVVTNMWTVCDHLKAYSDSFSLSGAVLIRGGIRRRVLLKVKCKAYNLIIRNKGSY